jgi:hypothetical protein
MWLEDVAYDNELIDSRNNVPFDLETISINKAKSIACDTSVNYD